jgi:predicted ATPase/DNA-binding CsgD family transcriptional regulator
VTVDGRLPGQVTSFIGRQVTIAVVARRLREERLVTLVGPGGCGKTRLVIEVGRSVSDRRQGVFFVDLSGLSDAGLVPRIVLHALGRRAAPGQDPAEALVEQVSDQELLVILDNCEHVLDACARLADSLARHCPKLWLLATSRERLGVTGEVIVPVEGLQLPDPAREDGKEWLEGSEAGRLFMDRARRVRPGFSVDDATATSVARICQRLDGIPLAIEMAAARTRLMSTYAIMEGLSARFDLLLDKQRVGPERHKTLLASLEWSCALLDDEERAFLRRLSVFASGFTLGAAEAVCSEGEIQPHNVLALLTSLVDKSLVQSNPEADRFRLHETMRAYASTALEAEGGSASVKDRHLGYFTELTVGMYLNSFTSELPASLVAVEPELDNIRLALDWAIESKQCEAGLALLESFGPFLWGRGLWPEGSASCERLLAAEPAPSGRAILLFKAAVFARNSEPSATLRLAMELTALGRSLGDDLAVSRGLQLVANVQAWAQPDEAVRTADQAIDFAKKAGLHSEVPNALHHKAWAYFWLGRPEEAFSLAEEGLRLASELDFIWGLVCNRTISSLSATYSGRPAQALKEAEALVQLSDQLSSPTFLCFAERHRGEAFMYLSDAGAQAAFARARALAEFAHDPFNLASTETCQGQLQVSLGQDEEGGRLLEAGISKLEGLGVARVCTRDRAVLAEAALRRGDFHGARKHLEASSQMLLGKAGPEAVPIQRAEARLARAEGRPRDAHSLACDGLDVAASSGQRLFAVDLLELVAITDTDLGDDLEAARLLGAAEAQRELTGYARWAPARDELAPVIAKLESGLGQEAFGQALFEGRALSLEEVVAYANRGRGSHSRATSGWESLTPAERRVAGLVAQHLTNAEIADKLFVSTSTVKSHLTRIFDKLGVAHRGQLVAVAAAHPAEPS